VEPDAARVPPHLARLPLRPLRRPAADRDDPAARVARVGGLVPGRHGARRLDGNTDRPVRRHRRPFARRKDGGSTGSSPLRHTRGGFGSAHRGNRWGSPPLDGRRRQHRDEPRRHDPPEVGPVSAQECRRTEKATRALWWPASRRSKRRMVAFPPLPAPHGRGSPAPGEAPCPGKGHDSGRPDGPSDLLKTRSPGTGGLLRFRGPGTSPLHLGTRGADVQLVFDRRSPAGLRSRPRPRASGRAAGGSSGTTTWAAAEQARLPALVGEWADD
jgi:hypothetical protein